MSVDREATREKLRAVAGIVEVRSGCAARGVCCRALLADGFVCQVLREDRDLGTREVEVRVDRGLQLERVRFECAFAGEGIGVAVPIRRTVAFYPFKGCSGSAFAEPGRGGLEPQAVGDTDVSLVFPFLEVGSEAIQGVA